MSAVGHLNSAQFEQLDMFRPARDLVDHTKMKHLDSSHYFDHDDMWEAKHGEVLERGMDESIAKHGILKPVAIAHNEEHAPRQVLADGHHRVIAAHELDPDYLVPVEHHDTHREYWFKHGRVMGDISHTGANAGDDSGWENSSYYAVSRARKHWAAQAGARSS